MTRTDPACDEACSRLRSLWMRFRQLMLAQPKAIGVHGLVVVTFAAASPAALGYDKELARAYFVHELAECGAWYTLVAEAPGLDLTTQFRFRAVGTSLVSTAADISTESWALAQMDVAMATIRREMRNSWNNYSVVDRKYGQRCRAVATDPAARRQYWLDKHD